MNVKLKLTALLIATITTTHLHADWPQYLGPDRNSTSTEKGILKQWPEKGPEVLWTAKVGIGYGGPAVKDGKVYLLDRDGDQNDILKCLDLSNGKELWTFKYEAPGRVMFPGSRSVPTLDGDYVYTCGHNGDLYCINTKTQKPVWNVNIWTKFGGKPPAAPGEGRRGGRSREAGGFPIWAITQCPLVYGDSLIVASQAPEAGVVAFDKRTGNVKWKTPSLGHVGYVSPIVAKIHGKDHIVMVTPSFNPFGGGDRDIDRLGKVIGIDPQSGKILWKYEKWNCHISVANPVEAGDNRLLIVGGYELGATMIQVHKKDDGTYETTELFTTEEFGDQTKPPVLHDGHFYSQYGTNRRRDGLVCMNLKGEIMWKTKRDPEFTKGSMILADGVILATNGMKKLYLIKPDPKKFHPLASTDLLNETQSDGRSMEARFGGSTQNWAPIALSNGKLLIRDQSQLKCVKVAE